MTSTLGLALNIQAGCNTCPALPLQVKGNVWAVVFGFVSILFITPCLGFALRYIPLQPREFTIGESDKGLGAAQVMPQGPHCRGMVLQLCHAPLCAAAFS